MLIVYSIVKKNTTNYIYKNGRRRGDENPMLIWLIKMGKNMLREVDEDTLAEVTSRLKINVINHG